MGAHTSSVLSELYLEFMEHDKLYTILLQKNILGYFRYVDDILIVYNDSNTDTDKALVHFITAIPTMTFSIKKNRITIRTSWISQYIGIQKTFPSAYIENQPQQIS